MRMRAWNLHGAGLSFMFSSERDEMRVVDAPHTKLPLISHNNNDSL